jgi:hypothetical protein
MNRVTGQVDTKTVQTEKPIVGVMNTLREVKTDHNTIVNLRTGKIIDPFVKPSFHGITTQ